jgi:hypothetical protein
MRTFRDTQLKAAGITDPVQRANQIASEYWQMSAMTLQQGGNPAQRLHEIAKATREAAQNAWGQPLPPAAGQAAAAAPDPAARLRMAQQGQEHSRGISNMRGNGPAPVTAARLMDLPDDDYDAIIKAMRSKEARKLMGA